MAQSGTTSVPATAPNNMKFLGFTGSYPLDKIFTLTGGQDLGVASFGLCKYGANAGLVCNFQKKPISLRMNFRYSTYQLNSGDSWKQLYNGTLDLMYRFKAKVEKKNKY